MRKLKRFFLAAMLMAVSLVTYFSVTEVYAAPTASVTINSYDYTQYTEYEFWSGWEEDYRIYTENVGYDGEDKANTYWNCTASGREAAYNMYATNDPTISCYEYYGNKYPSEILATSTPITTLDVKTEFAPGDKILFEFYIEVTTGFRSVRLGFNFGANGMGNANPLSDATNHASDYDISSVDNYYSITYNSAIMKATTSNSQTGHTNAYTGGYLESSASDITSKVKVGTIATTISSSASGEYTLSLDTEQKTKSFFGDSSDKYYAENMTLSGVSSIKVKSSTSNKTGLSSVKVGGTTLTSSSDTTIGTNVCPTYVASDATSTATSTSINVQTEDNAKIQNVYYVVKNEGEGLTSIPKGQTATGTTGSNSGTFTISPTTWNPGQVLYAIVEVKSSDGTTTGYNIIEIPKAKNDIKELTGLTITSNGTPSTVEWNTAFNKGTTSYTIKIASSTTVLTLSPTFDTTVGQTCTISGDSITSGGNKDVTVTTSTSYIDVVMTSQADNDQTYRINLYFLSDDKSLSTSNPIQVTYAGASNGTTNATSSNGTDYTATAPVGSTGFTVKANLKNTAKQKLSYSVDGGVTFTALNSGTNSASISFDSGLGASTKQVIVRVTAEDGSTKDYLVDVSRTAADDSKDISQFNLYAVTASGSNAISGSFDTARVFTVTNDLDYSVNGLQFKATFPTSATAVASTGTQTCTLTNGQLSDVFNFTGTGRAQLTITITVTAADTTTQEYTIVAYRRAADDNKDVTITIKDESGNVLATTNSGSEYTVTNTLPYTARGVYIQIDCGTYTEIKYDGDVITGQNLYQLAETPYFAWTFPFEFKVCTEINPTGYNLKINVKREAADQNVDLDTYSVVGKDDNITYTKKSTSTATNFVYEIPKSSAGSYYKLNVTALKETTAIYVSTVVPSGTNYGTLYDPAQNDFAIDTPLYVTLVAQGKATKTYVFNVKAVDERNDNPQIDNIVISGLPDGVTFNFEKSTEATKTFATITVPYSIKSLTITATLEEGFKGDNTGTSTWAKNDANKATALALNDNVLHFQGCAENGAIGCDYIITIHRLPAKTANLLTKLTINNTHVIIDPNDSSAPFTSTDNLIYYRFDRGVYTQATLDFEVSDGGDFIVSVNGNTSSSSPFTCNLVTGGKVVITIQVRSEKNKVDNVANYNTYIIELYVADNKFNVENIELLLNDGSNSSLTDVDGNVFDFNNGSYTDFTVPYKRTSAIPSVTLKADSLNADVTGEVGKNLTTPGTTASTTTFTIKVKSEYASLNSNITDQEVTYTIKVIREPAETDNRLKSLKLYVNGVETAFSNMTFDKDTNGVYMKELIAGGSTVSLTYEVNNPKATVDSTSDVGPFTLATQNSTREFTIKVLDELNNPREYKVKVSTDKLELDKNNAITSMQVFADNDLTKNLITYNSGDPSYDVNVRYTVNKIHLFFTLPVTTSTIQVNGVEVDKATLKYEYTLTTKPGANNIEVKCLAEDPSVAPNIYTIAVNSLTPDEDTSLKVFTINGTPVADGGTIYLPNETDTIDIAAERNSQYATLSPVNSDDPSKYTETGRSINVGSNTVTISVTNEKGVTKAHTVTVVRDDVLTLDSLTVVDPQYPTNNLVDLANPTSTNQNETIFVLSDLPYSVEKLDISCVTTALAENVTVTGVKVYELEDGKENVCTITVTAKSGANHKYIIKATRAQGDDKNFITSYKATEDGEVKNVGTTENIITYVVPKNTLVFTPFITVSENAKVDANTGLQYVISEANRNLSDGKNVFHITVTSQTGKANVYTFNVFRSDTDYSGTISLLESAGGANIKDMFGNELAWDANNECTLTFAYSTKMAYLDVTPNSADAVVYVDGKIFTSQTITINGNHTYVIYIKSEYGVDDPTASDTESPKYKLTINQEAANTDATLKELKVVINGVEYIATQTELDSLEFIIDNIGNEVSNITIMAEANVPAPKTSISGTGVKILNDLNVDAGDGSVTGYIFTYPIIVTPEDENTQPITYNVTVSRGPVNLDEHNTIDCITIIDSNGKEYLNKATFNPATESYDIEIPYGPQSYTIKVDKLEVSPATITGAGQFQITFTDGQDMVTEHVVFATSQNKVKGTEYKIKVTCKAPSDDSTLKDLKVDGVTVPGFDPEITEYILTTVYPNDITSISILAIVNDENANISGDIGTLSLREGANSFTVTVTSQGGSITNYKIIATRDYPLPYLTDLEIVGEKLLNDKNKETVFEKETLVYRAIVSFMDVSATINASVDNISHIVACNNAEVITNTGTTRTFRVMLNEGVNKFTISITSSNGKKVSYELLIQRRGPASTNTSIKYADILEIEQFKNDFDDYKNIYNYTVPNKIRDLNVSIVCENLATDINEGATYKVFNDKNLKVGQNQVIILITAEDKETTRAVIVNVERLPMDFTVNQEATNYTCTKKDDLTYVIDLGKDKASAIEDYTKYIEYAEGDNLSVEVLTNTKKNDCEEVIVRVSDGSEEKLVRFELITEGAAPSFNIVVWILLIVAIIILIVILITVNKDKYGTISKKRKNA